MATYGLGALGARTIGSYLREFEVGDPDHAVTSKNSVTDVVEALRAFFYDHYQMQVVSPLEAATGKKFAEIPREQWPVAGLIVGGFSSGAYLSEVWEIQVPIHDQPNTAVRVKGPGEFGLNWFAMGGPIYRYLLGYDPALRNNLTAQLVAMRGEAVPPTEQELYQAVLAGLAYEIPFNGMPMRRGVDFTRFLVELVINHRRFVAGQESVGGRATIGTVTYRGDRFQILD